MNLGIMQPYFFPNIGHFSLICHTNKWIVFDSVQFIRHGWIERNRILKPNEGWQYISVPLVKHSRDTLIKDVKIRTTENWEKKIFSQLEHYKKRAPFYQETIKLLNACFDIDTDSISKLNVHILNTICNHLSIEFNYDFDSTLDIDLEKINHSGGWALHISQLMNASSYTNPIGGKHLFDMGEFKKSNISLEFIESNTVVYKQKDNSFEGGLSIIDALMFNSVEEVRLLINNYQIS